VTGSPTNFSISLPTGTKTLIIWSAGLFKTYIVRFPQAGVELDWERNSSLPPWHTWGTHNTNSPFGATVAGAYCNFWMTSPVAMTLTISVP
jgi:hypothetical protein